MKTAFGNLKHFDKVVEFENAKELHNDLFKSEYDVGIEFEDKLKDLEKLPKNLKYSVRMSKHDYLDSWDTEHIFRKEFFSETIHENDIYFKRCFLCVQNVIGRQFITLLNSSKELPSVTLKVKMENSKIVFNFPNNFF